MGKARLDEQFKQHLDERRQLFVPYIMAGDGGLAQLNDTLTFLEESGASAIELGIPFSDPVADGPTIQEAGKRALKDGVSLTAILDELSKCRQSINIPIILMTYINPILQYGVEAFAKRCREVGVDGLILPDVPFDEQHMVRSYTDEHEIAIIQLVSLTSSIERQKVLAEASEGFLYAITLNGITGSRDTFESDLAEHFDNLKAHAHVPVLAGFGISTPEHVQTIGKLGDGVVVGSRIIDLLQDQNYDAIRELVQATLPNQSILN